MKKLIDGEQLRIHIPHENAEGLVDMNCKICGKELNQDEVEMGREICAGCCQDIDEETQ